MHVNQEHKKVEELLTQTSGFDAVCGDPAPEFRAKAFFDNRVVDIELNDYRGKWVYLFFYPSDFTFV